MTKVFVNDPTDIYMTLRLSHDNSLATAQDTRTQKHAFETSKQRLGDPAKAWTCLVLGQQGAGAYHHVQNILHYDTGYSEMLWTSVPCKTSASLL